MVSVCQFVTYTVAATHPQRATPQVYARTASGEALGKSQSVHRQKGTWSIEGAKKRIREAQPGSRAPKTQPSTAWKSHPIDAEDAHQQRRDVNKIVRHGGHGKRRTVEALEKAAGKVARKKTKEAEEPPTPQMGHSGQTREFKRTTDSRFGTIPADGVSKGQLRRTARWLAEADCVTSSKSASLLSVRSAATMDAVLHEQETASCR